MLTIMPSLLSGDSASACGVHFAIPPHLEYPIKGHYQHCTLFQLNGTARAAILTPVFPAAQLAERERQLEAMEKENEKSKSIREAEERLIATAFYNYVSVAASLERPGHGMVRQDRWHQVLSRVGDEIQIRASQELDSAAAYVLS